MSILAILGSSRSQGNTRLLLDTVLQEQPAERIDLAELRLTHYDYELPSNRDDFPRVARAMMRHRVIVFATPVYWYAMSGRMKVLFDRFTDLLTEENPLAGRTAFLVATGTKPELPEGFEVPFRDTALYLGMRYQGALYACMRNEGELAEVDRSRACEFAKRISHEASLPST